MYVLHDYARMIADRTRVAAYVRALEATVRPGSVVVDVGTGMGLFAIVACRLGARRVYAIDRNPVIELGRELARANSCADRIEFIEDDATKVELAERGDVVLSDLRGGMPLTPGNLEVVAHARERFLAPRGTMIPLRDVLKVGVVEAPEWYEHVVGPGDAVGVSLSGMRARLANEVHKDRSRSLHQGNLVAPGATWAVLDYAAPTPCFRGVAAWEMGEPRVGHGLLLWFDAVLVGSIGFSTEPGLPGVYPQLSLPWSEPVALRPGDRIEVELWAQPGGEPWGWNTNIIAPDGRSRVQFKQSSFLGGIRKPDAGRRPRAGDQEQYAVTAANDSGLDVDWLHSRSEDGTAGYRMGRQGALIIAEWPGVARLTCALDGSNRQLVPFPAASPAAVDKLGGVVRVLVGELAGGLGVHGAAVALDAGAVLLLGKSGAGKSTCAAVLCSRHHGQLLADDATLLEEHDGQVEVVPSERNHYLNRTSRDVVGVGAESEGSYDWKLAVPATAFAERGYPVRLVVCLNVGHPADVGHAAGGVGVLRRLTGAEAVAHMLGSMFRFNPLDEGARRRELDRVLQLYSQALFVEVRRPHSAYDPVPEIIDALRGVAHVR